VRSWFLSEEGPAVQVFINTGSCGNNSFENATAAFGITMALFPQSSRPRSIAVGQIDAGSSIDLIVGGWNSDTRVFLNNNGARCACRCGMCV
jgi:hypothetical protein